MTQAEDVAGAAAPTRLLVVDDDATRQQGLAKLLGDRFALSFVSEPDKVMAAARTSDVVLMNVLATRVHPFQILRRLKTGADAIDTPVLVSAPGNSVESVTRCLEMGVDDYVIEPLFAGLMSARIAKVIANQQLKLRLAEQEKADLVSAETLRVSEKYEHDVLIGRQIQGGFLPRSVPTVAGWEIAGRFQPAREVAGDWWDSFNLDQIRRVGLVIADVCDKGVGAALFMALMRSLIRAFAQMPSSLRWLDELGGDSPLAALAGGGGSAGSGRRREAPTAGSTALRNAIEQTNNYIAHNHGDTGMFATLFFGVLDPTTGVLQYINGGHEPPILIAADGTIRDRLKPTGMAVGMMEGSPFEIQTVHLAPGEMLLAYTDGVPEARDPDRKFFGEQRLLALASQPADSPVVLLDRVMDSLRAHILDADQFDDITMLAVRRAPEPLPQGG